MRHAPVALRCALAVVLAGAAVGAGASPALAAGDPLALTNGFYVDPNTSAATWVASHRADGRAASIKTSIADRPMARWFGNWSGDIGQAVGAFVGAADQADRLPVLVAYNLPGRDACGGHSAGGAGSPAAYYTWISAFADAIKDRPAIVIVEPDALGDFACMDAAAISTRNDLLRFASTQFRDRSPNTWAYLDAGNAGWVAANVMAGRLHAAGLANVRGFSVNVSNYYTTGQSATYGSSVNAALSRHGYQRSYVIDTSRNGNGSNGQWCNPAGRRIGTPPQKGGGAELLLWIKAPGESDGACGTAPGSPAGSFDPQLAYNLIYGY
ncbi:glycoside hydrolase family 6 protein [Spirilliplanes yamanashiensis]|uniref:Glucanase n=1 Tax=Spirilliplanes yamanashiensis TaxID=42233 RepID=A0A8J4DMK6_9ACTN|nr:glycoside hydrolase family 6 protein [Spirilliplanes yamanashiensis]MDP9818334.1 endoglucanase [Spirilliplanes yamanashiensis]GIJ06553.1 glucanase [Spirilliplanes yamanashiensis]